MASASALIDRHPHSPAIKGERESNPRWLLSALTLATIGTFLAANLYGQQRVVAVDELAEQIANNAAPSIRELNQVRGDLIGITVTCVRGVQIPELDAGATAQQFAALDADLHAQMRSYLHLPFFPGEDDLATGLSPSVADVEFQVGRLIGLLQLRALDEARELLLHSVLPSIDRSDALVQRLVTLNSTHVRIVSDRIASLRRSATTLSYGLHAVAAVAALALLAVASGLTRKYAKVAADRDRLIAERAIELDRFASRVAHDLKGPLSSIGLRANLAEKHASDPAEVGKSLDRIRSIVKGTNTLIDDLLAFARAAGRPELDARAEIVSAIEETVAQFRPSAEQAATSIALEANGPLWVACSRGAVASVVSNLLQNAIKYIAEGTSAARAIRIEVTRTRGRIRVAIADNGPGLPAGSEDAVFEPFVRVGRHASGGSGLGLATVKRIVEAHGGRVGVAPTQGGGSTFWFELPEYHGAALT